MNNSNAKTALGVTAHSRDAKSPLPQKQVFVVDRGPVELGVTPMKPVESFEAKSATVNPAILEIAVRLAPWVERTRLVPLAGPGYEETVESLRAQGYAPTKLAQALTIRDASWFPFRSLSFVARGDEFLSPLPDGRVATCHAAWDHEGRRFWSVSAADIPASLFDSYTRIEKRA